MSGSGGISACEQLDLECSTARLHVLRSEEALTTLNRCTGPKLRRIRFDDLEVDREPPQEYLAHQGIRLTTPGSCAPVVRASSVAAGERVLEICASSLGDVVFELGDVVVGGFVFERPQVEAPQFLLRVFGGGDPYRFNTSDNGGSLRDVGDYAVATTFRADESAPLLAMSETFFGPILRIELGIAGACTPSGAALPPTSVRLREIVVCGTLP